jgi:hypothetical protein
MHPYASDITHVLGDRRAPDANDDAVLPIVAASGLLSGLRVIMPISA